MPNTQSDFDDKLNVLKNNYYKRLDDNFNLLCALKEQIFDSNNFDEHNVISAFQEVYGIVHKLSGSCAMFGYRELSTVSNEFETVLKKFIESNCSIEKEIIYHNLEIMINEIEKALKQGS